MSKLITIIALLLFFSSTSFAQSTKELLKELEALKAKITTIEEANKINLEDPKQKLSYSLGVSIGTNLKSQIGNIIPIAFKKALEDVEKGETLLTPDQCNEYLRTEFTKLQEEKSTAMKEEGVKFLAENAKKEGVKTLESGLQYEVITPGTGAKPSASDNVTVHYTGYLIDGTIFDSSVERGEPATFGVGQVIRGWTEGLQLMSVGSKWKLYLPYDLAYGERGAGGDIPPYSTLIFEVELLGIEGK